MDLEIEEGQKYILDVMERFVYLKPSFVLREKIRLER